jgi:heptosyltransferase-2
VVVGVPVLQRLEARGVRFELIGKGWARPLLAGHGWKVHVRPKALRDRVRQLRELGAGLPRERLSVRGRRIDALLLATSFSAALEARLAGLRAMGYATDRRGLLLARSEVRPEGVHNLQEHWLLGNRLLGEELPAPREIGLAVAPAAQERADALLRAHELRPGGFVLLCPFAIGTLGGSSKVWPGFAEFAQVLLQRGVPVVVCPGPGEESWAQRDFPQALALHALPLDDYLGLMRRAALVVANDTGPGHMAAAVGAPLISVLGPTDAARWKPWGPQVQVVQEERTGAWPSVAAVLDRSNIHSFR